MQTGGCGRKTTSSFRYFDVVLVKWKTSPFQVSVLAGQCVFFAAGIPLFNSNITNFAFCAFKGVEETCGAYRLYGTRWGRNRSAHFPSFRLFVRFTCNSSLQMWRRLPLVL